MKAIDLVNTKPTKKGRKKKVYPYLGINMKSQIEVDFAHQLEMQRIAGKILKWEYEPIKLDIAPNLKRARHYSPDFVVTPMLIGKSKKIIYEVKGWTKYRGKGIARFENAANLYCHRFRFFFADASGSGFKITELEGK